MVKQKMILFFFGFLVLSGQAVGQAPPVLSPKSPILLTKVEGRMDHLGIDVKGQRLFATAFDNHTLEVIDLKTGRQVHTIADLDEPQGSFYDAANNRLFEANGGDGTVKIFDGTTFQLLQTVTLDLDADNVRYDTRAKHIIVGYGGEKFLAGKVARPGGGGAPGRRRRARDSGLRWKEGRGDRHGRSPRILSTEEDRNAGLCERPRQTGSRGGRSGEGQGAGPLAGYLHDEFPDGA
jgi:hypothetical protein